MWPISLAQNNLLQHLHLVAKEGGLVAEELGLVGQQVGHDDDDDDDAISINLVGQQVADGGDRGGELGGGIWGIWRIWRGRRSGLRCWWLRRWQKLGENEWERRYGGKKEEEEKERSCGLCHNFLRHLGPRRNVNWAQAANGSKSFPPLLMQSKLWQKGALLLHIVS